MVQIYLILIKKFNYYRYQFPCIFFCFPSNFSLLDPELHIECGSRSGSRRENECGSGPTALPPIPFLRQQLKYESEFLLLFC